MQLSGQPAEEIDAQGGVSAIVVTYFTGPLLARSIEALRAQREVDEIIVVDNGNWDGAVDEAIGDERASPRIVVITGHGNVGFATACNLGAREARGRYLFLLNPDAVPPPGALGDLLRGVDGRQGRWLVAPKLVNPDGTEQQGSRRETLTPWRAFVEATKLYRLAPRHPYFRRFNLHDDPAPDGLTELPTISGACFLIPKADYDSIGGMDERYFLHVEDIDFCLRFAQAGGAVLCDPRVEVVHFKSSSRVGKFGVERRKVTSAIAYFDRHFANAYPKPFLWLVYGLLWCGFAARESVRLASGVAAALGLSRRRGAAAGRRARAMSNRRASR